MNTFYLFLKHLLASGILTSNVCVYYVCVLVCVQVLAHTFSCVCGGQRSNSGAVPQELLILFYEMSFSWDPGFTITLD